MREDPFIRYEHEVRACESHLRSTGILSNQQITEMTQQYRAILYDDLIRLLQAGEWEGGDPNSLILK